MKLLRFRRDASAQQDIEDDASLSHGDAGCRPAPMPQSPCASDVTGPEASTHFFRTFLPEFPQRGQLRRFPRTHPRPRRKRLLLRTSRGPREEPAYVAETVDHAGSRDAGLNREPSRRGARRPPGSRRRAGLASPRPGAGGIGHGQRLRTVEAFLGRFEGTPRILPTEPQRTDPDEAHPATPIVGWNRLPQRKPTDLPPQPPRRGFGLLVQPQSGVPRTGVIGVEATIPWTFSLRR